MLSQLIALSENRVVVITGPNGSGKSTLLASFENWLFQQGKHFGSLSQHEGSFDEYSAFELYEIAGRREAICWADGLGITAQLRKPMSLLSSGERSKALIALALCFEIVVLDEPFSHLDTASRLKLEEIIRSSSNKFVIANHEPGAFSFGTSLELQARSE
jgi:ABC-type cobalamin/Fe3+-siderophores transport system ATPase subunit